MTNILDEIDIIKNIANIYDNNTSFSILKDMERVLDELDLYVYDNWKDGEIVSGPTVNRHWVSIKISWPRKSMPDPMGGKRLLDYDCQLSYQKSHVVRPKKIKKPSDIRPGTKKEISIFSLRSPVISSGARITSRAVSCGIISTGTLLILTLPTPFVMYTCALAVFLVAK